MPIYETGGQQVVENSTYLVALIFNDFVLLASADCDADLGYSGVSYLTRVDIQTSRCRASEFDLTDPFRTGISSIQIGSKIVAAGSIKHSIPNWGR